MNLHRQMLVIFVALGIGTSVALSAQDLQDEALFVRRIIEFWKDRESQIVIAQIRQFLQNYPNSTYKDSLLIILGDAFASRREYAKALEAYASIQAPHVREKVFNNRLDCLYRLDRYAELIQEIMPRLPDDFQQTMTADQALWMYYYAEALLHEGQQPHLSQDRILLARHYFERLLETEQKNNARLALAEIELSSGHSEQALALYLTSWNEGGNQADAVALPLLQLLFEQDKHAIIIQQEESLRHVLTPDKHPLLDYYVGRSHFALNQYNEAASYLLPLYHPLVEIAQFELEGGIVHEPVAEHEKNILLTLFSCYYHLSDRQGMETIGKQFQTKYPADPFNAKILHLQAEVCKNSNDLSKALALTESLLTKYPEYENSLQAAFDRALLLYQMRRWSESRAAFIALTEQHPGAPICLTALPHIPNATQQLLDEAEQRGEDLQALQEQLLQDIQAVLKEPEAIKLSQMPKYYLRLAKVLYDLQRYYAAMELLQVYIKEYPEDPLLDQGYLLIALCSQSLQDVPHFVEAAETLLRLKPDHAEKISLRLNLFSAYLQLSKAAQEPEPLISQAAEHLYQVLLTENEKIKPENKLWLANGWYEKLKVGANEYGAEPLSEASKLELAQRTAFAFEKALNRTADGVPVELAREPDLFKLSNVYGWLDRRDEQIALLEMLRQAQNAQPQQPWALRSRTLYALAYAYRALGESTTAQGYFKQLGALKTADPYLASAAKLEWARMTLETLPEERRTLDDPLMMAILKTLKDLQMRRVLSQEPIHLEAALDYAAARSALEPPEKRDEQMLFLLQRAKKEFSSQDDIWGKDYAASRQLDPAKETIFQAYMLLIDAHILRLEAKRAATREERVE